MPTEWLGLFGLCAETLREVMAASQVTDSRLEFAVWAQRSAGGLSAPAESSLGHIPFSRYYLQLDRLAFIVRKIHFHIDFNFSILVVLFGIR